MDTVDVKLVSSVYNTSPKAKYKNGASHDHQLCALTEEAAPETFIHPGRRTSVLLHQPEVWPARRATCRAGAAQAGRGSREAGPVRSES